jgi:hypothetical protein
MLSIISLSAGFSGPNSKLLALRGGISTDALSNTWIALGTVTGLQGWVAPKSTAEAYGIKDLSAQESFCLRANCGMSIVLAATMIAAENDIDQAASVCWLAWALSTFANVPLLERLGTDKGPIVACAALFGVIGELSRRGKMDAGLSANILNFMLIVGSAVEVFTPKKVFESFGMGEPSAVSKRLFENFDFVKLSTGLFLFTTKMTGKRGLGLAACTAGNVLNCIKAIIDADKVGLKKPALGVWAAVSAAIGLVAFKNEKP